MLALTVRGRAGLVALALAPAWGCSAVGAPDVTAKAQVSGPLWASASMDGSAPLDEASALAEPSTLGAEMAMSAATVGETSTLDWTPDWTPDSTPDSTPDATPDAADSSQPMADAPEPEPSCSPPESLDVLFIGNSYTIMHDLPSLVEALGSQAGIEVHAEMLARGGKDFEFHLARKTTARVLQEGDWDVVVLQSHSLHPLEDPEGFVATGEELAQLVRAAGAEPVFFETWARAEGHNLYNYHDGTGGSPEVMQARVHERYHELAERVDAQVVDVGAAWKATRRDAPELNLYAKDNAHPGELGAYLTANVLFAALTDVNPVGCVEPLMDIDDDIARLLQEKAAEVVEPRCPPS